MDQERAKERVQKLRREINYHRYRYHVLDKPEISDAALDSLKHELAKLEGQYPDLVTRDSPTQRVGGKALEKFEKVRHSVRMTSLEDAFSADELSLWRDRIQKLLPGHHVDFFAEAKGDGFAVSLMYENGIFRTGATRGDGLVGEDVTDNLRTIDSIPLCMNDQETILGAIGEEAEKIFRYLPRVKDAIEHIPKIVEVRGEVYMAKAAFTKINREQKAKGLPLFANPRNIAAGSVRQLDPKIAAARHLAFFAWDLVTAMGQETHEEEHALMKLLGFPVIPLAKACKTIEAVIEFWKEVGDMRERLGYLIDGVVVQVNNGKLFEELGVVGKAPRGAIALKFPGKEATTLVEGILVQVGRSGVLTPVARLSPVRIGGVMVSRATLHNLDEIRRLDVRIGDTVIVERAGDVIPAVSSVLIRMRPAGARVFHMPKRCPVCGSRVIHHQGEVAYRCASRNCTAIKREMLYHFVSKHAFDMSGIGPKIIDALLDNGLIRDAADLFSIKVEDVEQLVRFGEKSAVNLLDAIRGRKRIPLHRFLYALGIQHVGEETALALAKNFGSLQAILHASVEELERVHDIGGVVAKSLHKWFRATEHRTFLKKLERVGVAVEKVDRGGTSRRLGGKTFVLTGVLLTLTRDQAKERIRDAGGQVSGSVSKKTDYVVVGSAPGSKLAEARRLGVRVLTEEEFRRMIS